jgi:exoribonuclease-2
MREFESAHDTYNEFQRAMERYWCLRWLVQEQLERVEATVLRENLCRFVSLPLVARVASLPRMASGERVVLEVSDIDILELTFHCEFVARAEPSSAGDVKPASVLQANAAAP